MKKLLGLLGLLGTLGLIASPSFYVISCAGSTGPLSTPIKDVTKDINTYIEALKNMFKEPVDVDKLQATVDNVDKGSAKKAISQVVAKPLEGTPTTAKIDITLNTNFKVDDNSKLNLEIQNAINKNINSSTIKEKIDNTLNCQKFTRENAIATISGISGPGWTISSVNISQDNKKYEAIAKANSGFDIDGLPTVKISSSIEIDTTIHVNSEDVKKAIELTVNGNKYTSIVDAKNVIDGTKVDGITINSTVTKEGTWTANLTTKENYSLDGDSTISGKLALDLSIHIDSNNVNAAIEKTIKDQKYTSIDDAKKAIDGTKVDGITINSTVTRDGKWTAILTAKENYSLDGSSKISGTITLDFTTHVKSDDVKSAIETTIKDQKYTSIDDAKKAIDGTIVQGITINSTVTRDGKWTAILTAKENYSLDGSSKISGTITLDFTTHVKSDDVKSAIETTIKDQKYTSIDDAKKAIDGTIVQGITINSTVTRDGKWTAILTAKENYSLDGSSKISGTITLDFTTHVKSDDVKSAIETTIKDQKYTSIDDAKKAIDGTIVQGITINSTVTRDGKWTAILTAKENYSLDGSSKISGTITLDFTTHVKSDDVKSAIETTIKDQKYTSIDDAKKAIDGTIVQGITINSTVTRDGKWTAILTAKENYSLDGSSKISGTITLDFTTHVKSDDVKSAIETTIKDQKYTSIDDAKKAIDGTIVQGITINSTVTRDGKWTAILTAKENYSLDGSSKISGTITLDFTTHVKSDDVKSAIETTIKDQKYTSIDDAKKAIDGTIVQGITINSTVTRDGKWTAILTAKENYSLDGSSKISGTITLDFTTHVKSDDVKSAIETTIKDQKYTSIDDAKKAIDGTIVQGITINSTVTRDGKWTAILTAKENYSLDGSSKISGTITLDFTTHVKSDDVKSAIETTIKKQQYTSIDDAKKAIDGTIVQGITINSTVTRDGKWTAILTAKENYSLDGSSKISGTITLDFTTHVKSDDVKSAIETTIKKQQYTSIDDAKKAIDGTIVQGITINSTVTRDGKWTAILTAKENYSLDGSSKISGTITLDFTTHVKSEVVKKAIETTIKKQQYTSIDDAKKAIDGTIVQGITINSTVTRDGKWTAILTAKENYSLDGSSKISGTITLDFTTHVKSEVVKKAIDDALKDKKFGAITDAEKAIDSVKVKGIKIDSSVEKDGTWSATLTAETGYTLDGDNKISGKLNYDSSPIFKGWVQEAVDAVVNAVDDKGTQVSYPSAEAAKKAIDGVKYDGVKIDSTVDENGNWSAVLTGLNGNVITGGTTISGKLIIDNNQNDTKQDLIFFRLFYN